MLLDDPDVNGTLEPFQLTVPPGRYAVLDLTEDGRVPPGSPTSPWRR